MNCIKAFLTLGAAAVAVNAAADRVASFNMDVRDGQIVEAVSGQRFGVGGHFTPENVPGAVGKALRFDGYTSFVDARLGNILPSGTKKLTVSLWVAVPCYPIIEIDVNTQQKTPIVSCLNEADRTGFGFFLGFDGKYSFRCYVGGWPVDINVDSPLPVYTWNNLTAVVDGEARTARLYNNGTEVGSARANGDISFAPSTFYMGQGAESRMSGPFELMSFNGLIDDITIWNEAIDQATIAGWKPENAADLSIPASRFANDQLRPRFHGMPATAWTNECHGMIYSAGRYHLFFQKNADGPYMARLHWGHLTSENLYDWHEEKIAIAPGAPYDIKGCWSGCVFSDPIIGGGHPTIIYTGVDYGRASIDQASPDNSGLTEWTKLSRNPIITARPAGLSDDFRDPYFFRNGDNAYIIVGSSRNGVGTTTLHRYNATTGNWSNNGDLFFSGSSAAQDGIFWEMPNITRMPDGRWLFTATPIGTSQGVRTLYWTGTINADGTFNPASATPKLVEMTSRHGFGLLSPTIYVRDGKTVALGIVPDKLSDGNNWNLGWAHCYSLPREWSLADDGTLIQKPWPTLTGLPTATASSRADFDLDGTLDLSPVSGRAVELCGTFTVGTTPFGFNIFKNSAAKGSITYNPATGEIVADFSSLTRLINDGGVYDGVYRCVLPQRPRRGSDLKINVFVDHSIVDIFVNDSWATSIRVFPTDNNADGVEVFSNNTVKVKELKAWILDPKASSSGVEDIALPDSQEPDAPVSVYTVDGRLVRSGVPAAEATEGLAAGLYIVGHRKVLVK